MLPSNPLTSVPATLRRFPTGQPVGSCPAARCVAGSLSRARSSVPQGLLGGWPLKVFHHPHPTVVSVSLLLALDGVVEAELLPFPLGDLHQLLDVPRVRLFKAW